MPSSVNEILRVAKRLAKNGDLDQAARHYQSVLEKFPENQQAKAGLAALQNQGPANSVNKATPSQEEVGKLIELYQAGKFQQALKDCEVFERRFPSLPFFPNLKGVIHSAQGQLDAALQCYDNAIRISPGFADAHNNRGNALKRLGRVEEAVPCYQDALKFNPNYVEAHNNLGDALAALKTLNEAIDCYRKAIALNSKFAPAYYGLGTAQLQLGQLDDAIESFKRSLQIFPNYAEAISNLGKTYFDKGMFDESTTCYLKALRIRPGYADAIKNLISVLTYHVPATSIDHPVVLAAKSIREISLTFDDSRAIPDDLIAELYTECLRVLEQQNLSVQLDLSQAYRRNNDIYNCERHMAIFTKHNVIPEYCFGCYKVQIEPRTVVELCKLLLVFDGIELENNNIRKCLVELRSGIPGFYKGLVYCSSIEEASSIMEQLKTSISAAISPEIPVLIKRGCSEYPLSYPLYKEINSSGEQPMSYNQSWAAIEHAHDKKYPLKPSLQGPTSLTGLSLSDVLIMQNWLAYAKEIGDHSADSIISEYPSSNFIAAKVKERGLIFTNETS